jgi:hypothetical protein
MAATLAESTSSDPWRYDRRRGLKIRFCGDCEDPGKCSDAAEYMKGFALHQTGDAGDITAGREPVDYSRLPYFEWYSKENGRVVVETDYDDVEVIGRPIPACESDPISRPEQNQHMASFLCDIGRKIGVTAVAPAQQIISDPRFTHWILQDGAIVGEARTVQPGSNGSCAACVRYFVTPDELQEVHIDRANLQSKSASC